MKVKKQKEETIPAIARRRAIEVLHDLLVSEFGADFSYTIVGNGKLIAASNSVDGVVKPLPKS